MKPGDVGRLTPEGQDLVGSGYEQGGRWCVRCDVKLDPTDSWCWFCEKADELYRWVPAGGQMAWRKVE